jgi:ribonuclease HII
MANLKIICLVLNFLAIRRVSAFATKKNAVSVENNLYQKGYQYIIGTDEVGRGSIAGPVLSTSCCIFLQNFEGPIELIPGVNDSKELSEEERQIIFQKVLDQPSVYKFKCAQRSSEQIDQVNIMKATMECFQESIQDLILSEEIPLDLAYAVCDGKSTPKLIGGPTPIPCRPMVNADAKVYTVSLASIIAKVTRDRIMTEAHEIWPQYNFHLNKGYSTRDHVERVHKYGPCPLHRMSFKALKHR